MEEFRSRGKASGCHDALERARGDLKQHFGSKQTQWSKNDARQYKPDWDGAKLQVNQSGIAQVYWIKPDGTQSRNTISGGHNSGIAPEKDTSGVAEDRYIHSVPEGIDVRNVDGQSIPHKRHKNTYVNPTFPGLLLKEKMTEAGMEDCAELWEFHIKMDFYDTFALDQGTNPCERCIDDRKTCDGKRPCQPCKKAAKGSKNPPKGYAEKKQEQQQGWNGHCQDYWHASWPKAYIEYYAGSHYPIGWHSTHAGRGRRRSTTVTA